MPNPAPIGLFDSGVGGLSVMREVRRLLPKEELLYFADSAYCPYGVKAPEVIRSRSFAIGDFFMGCGVKMIVVASNTTSSAGLEAMRQRYSLPIVGVEPAVKPAVASSRKGKVGVLATGVTIASPRFSTLVERFGEGVEVLTQPCPGLVEMVEAGNNEGAEVEALLRRYLEPILTQGADTVVLGCTHYPFLRQTVQSIVGPEVLVVDSGEAVARQVARILEQRDQTTPSATIGRERFFTSGDPHRVEPVVRLLWGDNTLTLQRISL